MSMCERKGMLWVGMTASQFEIVKPLVPQCKCSAAFLVPRGSEAGVRPGGQAGSGCWSRGLPSVAQRQAPPALQTKRRTRESRRLSTSALCQNGADCRRSRALSRTESGPELELLGAFPPRPASSALAGLSRPRVVRSRPGAQGCCVGTEQSVCKRSC